MIQQAVSAGNLRPDTCTGSRSNTVVVHTVLQQDVRKAHGLQASRRQRTSAWTNSTRSSEQAHPREHLFRQRLVTGMFSEVHVELEALPLVVVQHLLR